MVGSNLKRPARCKPLPTGRTAVKRKPATHVAGFRALEVAPKTIAPRNQSVKVCGPWLRSSTG